MRRKWSWKFFLRWTRRQNWRLAIKISPICDSCKLTSGRFTRGSRYAAASQIRKSSKSRSEERRQLINLIISYGNRLALSRELQRAQFSRKFAWSRSNFICDMNKKNKLEGQQFFTWNCTSDSPQAIGCYKRFLLLNYEFLLLTFISFWAATVSLSMAFNCFASHGITSHFVGCN